MFARLLGMDELAWKCEMTHFLERPPDFPPSDIGPMAILEERGPK